MTLEACAGIVERGDPDRHLTVLSAPAAARRILWPLYAMNIEIARAPWVTKEPLIARMRLQWWIDAMNEIAVGGPVRRHEVTAPLALILDSEGALAMADLARAREADIENRPFGNAAQLWSHLDRVSGTLVWTAARLLGAEGEGEIRRAGQVLGLANLLQAVPELLARGRTPLPDISPEAVRALAEDALGGLDTVRRVTVPGPARAALRAGWLARAVLRRAAADPGAALKAPLGVSEARRKAALLWRVLLNRW